MPGEFGKKVTVDRENTTLFASDRNMFVFLADEDRRIEVAGRRQWVVDEFGPAELFECGEDQGLVLGGDAEALDEATVEGELTAVAIPIGTGGGAVGRGGVGVDWVVIW